MEIKEQSPALRHYLGRSLWRVWRPDFGENEDEARPINARSGPEAAQLFAEHQDALGDFETARAGVAMFHVREDTGDAENARSAMICEVTVESVPVYSARILPTRPDDARCKLCGVQRAKVTAEAPHCAGKDTPPRTQHQWDV